MVVTIRGIRARDGNQMCSLLRGEGTWATGLGLVFDRSIQAAGRKPATHSLHGGSTGAERLDDLLVVRPGRHLQEDPGSRGDTGGRLATRDSLFELGALVVGEVNMVS